MIAYWEIAVFFGFFMLGLLAGWLAARFRAQRMVEGAAAENRALSANLESSGKELAQIRVQYMEAEKKLAALESALTYERKAAAEKAQVFESMRDTMIESFTAISSRALKDNNQSFMDLAKATFTGYVENARTDFDHKKEAVKAFVAPLSEALIKYDQQIRSMEQAREKAYGGLSQQVADLAETQKSLQQETGKLVRALRLPQVRGRWGELTLRRVVEIAGMQNHCDFFEQQTSGTGSGAMRPDMIVKLPGNRQVVIDAKVSIVAYLDALETEDGEERDARLDDHARQVRSHVNGLAKKAYWATFTPTPEFVVLFMPGENFFSAALERDPSLIEESAEKGVILATPTTLISLLKTVSYAWRQNLAAENAEKVSELGNELYTRLYAMVEHINHLGRDIDRCVTTYNKAVGSLERRVLVSARKFIDMGAASEDRKSLDAPAIIENKPRQMEAPDEPDDPVDG